MVVAEATPENPNKIAKNNKLMLQKNPFHQTFLFILLPSFK
jgi:hypothetical protein